MFGLSKKVLKIQNKAQSKRLNEEVKISNELLKERDKLRQQVSVGDASIQILQSKIIELQESWRREAIELASKEPRVIEKIEIVEKITIDEELQKRYNNLDQELMKVRDELIVCEARRIDSYNEADTLQTQNNNCNDLITTLNNRLADLESKKTIEGWESEQQGKLKIEIKELQDLNFARSNYIDRLEEKVQEQREINRAAISEVETLRKGKKIPLHQIKDINDLDFTTPRRNKDEEKRKYKKINHYVASDGEKYCTECNHCWPINDFGNDAKSEDDLARKCRNCTNREARERYQKNPEAGRKNKRKSYYKIRNKSVPKGLKKKKGKTKVFVNMEKRAKAAQQEDDKHKQCWGACGLILPNEEFNKGQKLCKDCQSVVQNLRNKYKKKGIKFNRPVTKGSKVCSGKNTCGTEKYIFKFSFNPRTIDGRGIICKACIRKFTTKSKPIQPIQV